MTTRNLKQNHKEIQVQFQAVNTQEIILAIQHQNHHINHRTNGKRKKILMKVVVIT